MFASNIKKGIARALLPSALILLTASCNDQAENIPYDPADGGKKDKSASDVVLDRPAGKHFVPGEVIVKLKPGAATALSIQNITALGLESTPVRTSGGELVYKLQEGVMTQLQAQSKEAPNTRLLEIVEQLQALPNVEYAQPNWILQPFKTPNDTLYPKQWHYFNNGSGAGESPGGINLSKAWEKTTGSSSVVVAVIDTGILKNHPDIVGSPNLVDGYDMISDKSKANDGDGRDSDATDAGDAMKKGECFFGLFPDRDSPSSWHGTHVAGTVGVGKTNNGVGIAGINWNVKVQPIRVLGKCGGSTTDINDGIRWAAGLNVPGVPNNATPAKVINMSLGGEQPCSQSPATQQAINDAVNAGVTVVVAAGNSGKDASGFNPAGCDNVITVAAGDPLGKLTPYSNWGNVVEIMAPGGWTERGCPKPEGGVLSMVQTATDRGNCGVPDAYAFYNGTSMASPHVAGVAALLLAAEPSLTPAQVSKRIPDTAIPRTAEQCPPSTPCGAGLLDASRAVGGDGGEPPTPPPPTAPTARFEYAAKLVCGAQTDPKGMKLATGFYATTINIHNPGKEKVGFAKKLALTAPPGEQRPGAVKQIANDELAPDQALAVDCDDLKERVFGGTLPTPYIEGFVIIQSPQSLDVTAVYSTATLNSDGMPENHTSIHVEQIRERTR
jgi:serine protease